MECTVFKTKQNKTKQKIFSRGVGFVFVER